MLTASLPPALTSALRSTNRAPRILLRSSWQTVNIGDIGHTPGLLALLARHLPDAQIMLWPGQLDRGVREMLIRWFPALEIVEGDVDNNGAPSTPSLRRAFDEADFLIHGSGPYVVAMDHVIAWRRHTGKPYGIYGVTIDPLGAGAVGRDTPDEGTSLSVQRAAVQALSGDHLAPHVREVLEDAEFVFCRDTLSLNYLRTQKVARTQLDFAPDAAFGIEIRDEVAAGAFMRAHDLRDGGFLCVVPRLRFTPYHLTHGTEPTARDKLRTTISTRHAEDDFAKVRAAIVGWVRETGLKVLLCPEMTYQVQVGREFILDRLPDDVRPLVVWRPDYWLPDEACATYARAAALLSLDNHSPIFALAMGVPSIFLRQPTDTIKGQMWPDLGLGDWFMEIEATTAETLTARLLSLVRRPDENRRRVARVLAAVRVAQWRSLQVVCRCVYTATERVQ